MSEASRRVVLVTQMFPPEKGGNASRIHDTARHLDDQGWDVSVLSPPPCYPPGEFDTSWQRASTDAVDGVTVHRLWTWQPRTENPGMARRLPYYLLFGIHAMCWLLWHAREYEVVVTSTPPISTGAPGLLAAMLGKPWVVDVRDLWIDASISLGYLAQGSAIERISRRFQRLVLQTADRIAVTTAATGESIRETYGASLQEKTIVVPNGVDTDRFRPGVASAVTVDDAADSAPASMDDAADSTTASMDDAASPWAATVDDDAGKRSGGQPPDPASSRQRSGETTVLADSAGPSVVYTGNLGSAQDLESCIEAMAHLSREDATLYLIGSGDLESRLQRLTAEFGVEGRVEFVDPVEREQVPAVLDEATVGVAPLEDTPELAYAMPTKLYEYAACGLPVVTTGRGEIERFVTESGGGVHAANDPERIAAQWDRLFDDEQLRRRLGERGRAYVVENYDRQAIARKLGEQLHQVVDGERGRSHTSPTPAWS